MAGVAEASAVITVLQVGASLALALHTYVGDYKDARDDIIALATEIDATLYQVKDLTHLVATNKTAKNFDDSNARIVEKCHRDSARQITKLIKLLAKAGVPADLTRSVNPKDINVSRFRRAYWPALKPQVEAIKRELDSTRIEILLLRNCIDARLAPTAAQRETANELIGGLCRALEANQKAMTDGFSRTSQLPDQPLPANALPATVLQAESYFASRELPREAAIERLSTPRSESAIDYVAYSAGVLENTGTDRKSVV